MRRRLRAATGQGQRSHLRMTVTLEDVLHGAEKTISLRQNGQTQNVSVKIPKGIEDGKRLRFPEKGRLHRPAVRPAISI
jgi:curved DNA-binding protein